jgi:hypothetical protein
MRQQTLLPPSEKENAADKNSAKVPLSEGCVAIRDQYRAILHLAIDNLFAKIEAVLNRFIFGFVCVRGAKF